MAKSMLDSKLDSSNDGDEQRVVHGTRWVLSLQIAGQLLSLIVIACLYRLVPIGDFGLLGMILPWMYLLRLVTTQGVGIATIQSSDLSNSQLSSLFWVNVAIGFFASIVTAAGAYGLALLYQAPELTRIGLILSGTSLIAAIGSQHFALLEKSLHFRSASLIRLASQAAAGITAIAYAFWAKRNGRPGYEALLMQQYVELIVLAAAAWWASGWRPERRVSISAIRNLLQFSGYYGSANLVFFASRNIDKVLLSLLLGQSEIGRQWIGLYSQAFNQMMKPVHVVVTPLTSILLPSLSRAQVDPARYAELIRRFYRFTVLVLAPVATGIFVTADDVFVLLGGSEWELAGMLLRNLSLVIAAQAMIDLCGSIYASKGNGRGLFVSSLLKSLVLLIALLGCTYWVRSSHTTLESIPPELTIRMSQTYTVTVLLLAPLLVAICLAWNRVKVQSLLVTVGIPSGLALWMGLVAWSLREILELSGLPGPWRLAIVIPAGVLFYAWLGRDMIRKSWADLFQHQSSTNTSPPKSSISS